MTFACGLAAAAALAVAPPPPQTTRLSLPFDGIWGVLQGMNGQTHVGYAAYALDFVPAQPLGTPAPAKGAPLRAFACYDRPILAPADGIVVRAHGAARDWPAYRKGRDEGNFVILQHAPREYTEFRHLAAGSVTVRVGDRVRRGQAIGRCGNSGNAFMPHLHVGLLAAVDPIWTRPMVFSDYEVVSDEARWEPGDGVLRTNEIIRSAPPKH
jgi:murein DD-endopeptidase MepM/ murein hydrolase activator NlpD